ncbi:MAG: sortase [Anaerolineaceae bacterium]|nr:sortase [Anaerolineaceae bacterium]
MSNSPKSSSGIMNYLAMFLGLGVILFGGWRMIAEVTPVLANPLPAKEVVVVREGLSNYLGITYNLTLPPVAAKPAKPQLPRAQFPQQEIDPKASSRTAAEIFTPDRLVIPSISLDATVMNARKFNTEVDGNTFGQYLAPNKSAVGWHPDSATLGKNGNTVLNGHHNVYGEIFKDLVDVQVGDQIYVYSGETIFAYEVVNKMILLERYAPLAVRLENSRWLSRSADERLTLVTCWPFTSNTHRLVLVASPIGQVSTPRPNP